MENGIEGDQAFRRKDLLGRNPEMTFGGALSFLRRNYTRDLDDVDIAVNVAKDVFENNWSKLHPKDRAKYLRLIADQLRANAEHLGKIETIDTGKLYRETKTQANYIAEYYLSLIHI